MRAAGCARPGFRRLDLAARRVCYSCMGDSPRHLARRIQKSGAGEYRSDAEVDLLCGGNVAKRTARTPTKSIPEGVENIG
jgi:hypothetical protein